jgi:hypothetical protein
MAAPDHQHDRRLSGARLTSARLSTMLIRNFGYFWRRDEVDWHPGSGRRFELLGRRGANRPGLRIADFRDQRGLYVLYGNYGPHYVGLADKRGIGDRLKDHTSDLHGEGWDRFCWFGFRRVLSGRDDERRLWRLASPAEWAMGGRSSVIRDMEALLIKALGCPSNLAKTGFPRGDEWFQIKQHEAETYLRRAGAS